MKSVHKMTNVTLGEDSLRELNLTNSVGGVIPAKLSTDRWTDEWMDRRVDRWMDASPWRELIGPSAR